jgi:threonine/homoserine/homoserine lactone efflux protein
MLSGMTEEVFQFLFTALVISLSGVMAPGPVTAAALAAGTRRRHAGALIAVGHGIVEFPLMFLILAGIGVVLRWRGVQIGIGLIGGAFLVLMGVGMLRDVLKGPAAANAAKPAAGAPIHGPVWTGVILTGGNPYFLLWWATVGLALAMRARDLGALAFVLFAIVHWLCDLVWLEALSLASFNGSRLLGGRVQRIVLSICAAAMLFFGGMFAWDAGKNWLKGPPATQPAARMRDRMRMLDYPDAELAGESTCPTVRPAGAVAQVDHEARAVSLLAVQALSGVAAHEQWVPLFFARGGFSRSVQQGASRAAKRPFGFDELGQVEGIGRLGVCMA